MNKLLLYGGLMLKGFDVVVKCFITVLIILALLKYIGS